MTALGDKIVNGNGSGDRNWPSQDYTTIDESVGTSGEDNDYIQGPNNSGGTNYATTFMLENMPSDFSSMNSLNYNIRYRRDQTPPASRPDALGLSIRIIVPGDPITVLAAADSGGTPQVINADITSTSFASHGDTAFSYVNASNKTNWDAAQVEITQTDAKNGGPDGHRIEVASFDISGDYNAAAPQQAIMIS